MRWLTRIVGALVLLLVIAWGLLHWFIVPRIDEFRPRLQALASRALDTSVTIGALRAESNGLVPSVSLHDVQIHDPTGRAGLRVPRAVVAFSVISLVRGELEQLVIEQPELELRRTAEGRLLVAGLDLSGDSSGDTGAADWFFSQQEFLVLGGRVRWVDESRAVDPVSLSDVQVVLRNGRRRHQVRIDATPDAAWGQRFTLIGQFRQPVFSRHAGQWQAWNGQLYADLPHVDVSRLRQYVDLKTDWGVDLQRGQGALRLWADVDRGALRGATADLALGAVEARFGPQLQPLAFASLTGRLGWREDGQGLVLSTRGLQFVDADGLAWPGGNFQLGYREGQGAHGGGSLTGDKLDLAALAKIASRLPLPPAVHQRLKDHPVQGLVDSLNASWSGALDAPRDWRVNARVSALSVGALPGPVRAGGVADTGMPGVEGAALVLEATPAGGQAALDIHDGALEFPGVFEEPRIPVTSLSARARWRVQGERIALDVDEFKLVNADATGSFKAQWHTAEVKGQDDARFPGVMDLQGSFSRANGARVHRYLPLGIPADARHYVRDAIVKGDARDFQVHVKGDLRHVGSSHPPPGTEFRFAGQVSGVTMAYVPRRLQPAGQLPWPALEELAGELVFDHSSMLVKDARGKVQGHPGWQFTRVNVGIADLGHTRVVVDADGRGPMAAALGIVKASPVAGFTHQVLDAATATGDAGLQLKLDLPITRIEQSKVEGRIQLQGNDLRVTADTPLLAHAQGVVGFTDTGFSIQDVRARMLGGDVRIGGGTQPGTSQVTVRASGSATAEGLAQMTDWAPLPAIARQARGSAAYELVLGFGADHTDVLVTSDLRGLGLELPAPLAKTADAAWPLRYESRQLRKEGVSVGSQLKISASDLLAMEYVRESSAAGTPVTRGALALGAAAVAQIGLPAQGVVANVQLPRLEVGEWDDLRKRAQSGDAAGAGGADASHLPSSWALRVDELVLDERSLHAVSATGTQAGGTWRADVQARELAGRLEFSEGADGRAGKVHARLARLSIPAVQGDTNAPAFAEPPAHIPALDVVVDDFELRGKKLGRLELEAVNHDVAPTRQSSTGMQEWQLTRLSIKVPEATLTASGRWAALARAPALPADPRAPRPGEQRRTALDFTLDIRDAGALLTRFDMPGVIARGKGQLGGHLAWAGTPFSPHYPSLDGQLHVDVGAGQFLKADPGIAKLLGVLSLQALPRRLTLDFRDLFSTGFAFDFVRGDATLQHGVARTNNLQMKGVNAAVLMDGSADIAKETQNLRVLVVPEIDAGTAALAATVINPAIGIGAFIAQLVLKRPLIKAATREFQVGGTWDDPQVMPINARTDKPATTPPAPLPENAPMEDTKS